MNCQSICWSFCLLTLLSIHVCAKAQHKYTADWKSLDKRPLPSWFDDGKFGIFVVWGVYSVPAIISEWFWYYWKTKRSAEAVQFMQRNFRPGFTYADFGPMFTAEFYNATRFAQIIKNSGASLINLLAGVPNICASIPQYTADWKSLDRRPLPQWYDEAKFGIFLHWGVFSVPSIISEWFWYYWRTQRTEEAVRFMEKNFKPGFTYADFGPMFMAEFFNATRFAQSIKHAGAKYVVLTSKHVEGYTMWPSNYSWNWNSKDVGPNRDVVGELRDAILNVGGVHFGLYYCLYEWYNRIYLSDKENHYKTQEFVEMVTQPQMRELIETYRPDVFWSDGEYEADYKYWNSTEFLAWLYNSSPVRDSVVVNDRWGHGTMCKHGGYMTCHDKYNPGVLQPFKWESCMTVDNYSWGFRRTMTYENVISTKQILTLLAEIISCGGNLLLNVGPTHDGRIDPIFEERLSQIGTWLKVNGEAVYSTKPWIFQNDTINSNVWYTSKLRGTDFGLRYDPNRLFNPQEVENTIVYAFVTKWPPEGILTLGAPLATPKTKVSMLGYRTEIGHKTSPEGLQVELGQIPWEKLPSVWAWVLKLEYLQPDNRNPLATSTARMAR